MTTNGQAPFVTVFMYLGEVSDPQTKHDLALMIENSETEISGSQERIRSVDNARISEADICFGGR